MFVISVPTTPGTALRWAMRSGGHDIEQFVAVVEAPLGVDHLQAVGVASSAMP